MEAQVMPGAARPYARGGDDKGAIWVILLCEAETSKIPSVARNDKGAGMAYLRG